MNTKRIKAIAKLGVLFGTPLALIFALFSWGVNYGARHRDAITQFERDWLGLEVEVAPPYEGGDDEDKGEDQAKDDKEAKDEETEGKRAAEKTDEGGDASSAGSESEDGSAERDRQPASEQGEREQPAPVPPPQGDPSPAVVDPPASDVPAPRVDPLAGELSQRLQLPVTIELKVLVDPALADDRPGWIDYVQRSVAEASRIYQKQFGIELTVVGVGRWPTAVAGLEGGELLEDLQSRPREAGQILIGLTAHELEEPGVDAPASNDAFNGAYAVVGPVAGHGQPHLPGLLREISRLLGARPVTDPGHPDYQAGSWMRSAAVAPSQAPWIDAANRQRILQRKDRPFRPEPADAEPDAAARGEER